MRNGAQVDNENHARLEVEVTEFLRGHGFLIDAATYHDKMRPDLVERLRFVDTPTALYVRGRADRVAVHSTLPVCFEFECKTKSYARRDKPDVFIEALPLAHHVLKAVLGARVLYVYRDDYMPLSFGIWAELIPEIVDEVRITPRAVAAGVAPFLKVLFGDKCQPWTYGNGGSGDAYIVIGRDRVLEASDFRLEVIAELHPFMRERQA